jgi:uncharacterized protein (TIGR03435 family)
MPVLLISVFLLFSPQSTRTALRRFEVSSIKPNNSGPLRPNAQGQMTSPFQLRPGGLFIGTNVTLLEVLTFFAPKNQMEGGPEWIDSDRFDINAKADLSAGEIKAFTDGGQEDWKQMIQGLLEDRFKLKMHRETKEISVLALAVGKDPVKLQEYKSGPRGSLEPAARGRIIFHGVPVSSLAGHLSNVLHTRVIDATNMSGRYDFALDPLQFATANDPNSKYEDLVITAVEELGFKLEKRKMPLEITIIDHAEKPDAN